MKKYCYYVSYSYKDKTGNGFGSFDILTNAKVNTADRMYELIDCVKEKNKFDFVVVNNLIYLGVKKG